MHSDGTFRFDCFGKQKKKKKNTENRHAKERCNTRTSQEVTHPSTIDGIRCISAGIIAPVKCGLINAYMASVTGLISNTWHVMGPERNGGVSSLKSKRIVFYIVILSVVGEVMVLLDLIVSASRKEKSLEKRHTKKRCNTRTSQEVTHPSTTLAQARLTAEF